MNRNLGVGSQEPNGQGYLLTGTSSLGIELMSLKLGEHQFLFHTDTGTMGPEVGIGQIFQEPKRTVLGLTESGFRILPKSFSGKLYPS